MIWKPTRGRIVSWRNQRFTSTPLKILRPNLRLRKCSCLVVLKAINYCKQFVRCLSQAICYGKQLTSWCRTSISGRDHLWTKLVCPRWRSVWKNAVRISSDCARLNWEHRIRIVHWRYWFNYNVSTIRFKGFLIWFKCWVVICCKKITGRR